MNKTTPLKTKTHSKTYIHHTITLSEKGTGKGKGELNIILTCIFVWVWGVACNVKKMKLNLKNILIESFGIILLVFGIEKWRVSMLDEEYLALFAGDMDKFNSLSSETIGSFMADNVMWGVGAYVTGFVIIGILKILNKDIKGLLDSLVAFIILFSLFPLGFFGAAFTNSIINFVGGIITENFKIKFMINGLLWTLIGIGIIWFALKKKKTLPKMKSKNL